MNLLKLAFALTLTVDLSAQDRPNIIFILADDLGYGDVGILWQNEKEGDKKLKTPFIDQMAREGMILNRHYCPAPVCAPSRGSLLTGLHQGHANVRDNQFDKALEDNHNLANLLQKAGYFTAIIGKYGLQGKGGNSPQSWEAYPTKRGFDYFFGYVTHKAGHTHYPHHLTTRHKSDLYDQNENIAADLSKCFTPDLFTARAKKLIEDEVNDGDDQPFFLYLAYDTPHAALQLPTVEYPGCNVDNPNDDSGLGLDGGVQWIGKPGKMINTAEGEIDSYRHPDYTINVQHTWTDLEERQAGLVRRMDDNIGDLRKTLKDLGIEKNTLIVFSSDNGPHTESYYPNSETRDGKAYKADAFEGFGPFEGVKRDCWEGGIREPSFAVWPGTVLAGVKSEQVSQFHDWLPTFCDLAGLNYPARTDGVSLVPTLTGKGKQKQTTTYIEYNNNSKAPKYEQFTNHGGASRKQAQVIFIDGYKGIRHSPMKANKDFAIYDVSKDFKESADLANSSTYFKDLNDRMKKRVLRIRMPDQSAKRPWDDALVPAVTGLSDLNGGVEVKSYTGEWGWVPEFRELVPTKVTVTKSLNSIEISPLVIEGGALCEGFIKVPTSGEWTFSLSSGSKALLKVHDKMAIDNDFNYSSKEVTVSMNLEAGYHPIRLYIMKGENGDSNVSLKWKSSETPRQKVDVFYKVK